MNLLIAGTRRVRLGHGLALPCLVLPYRGKELSGMTYRPIGIVPLRNYGAASYRVTCVLHRVKSKATERPRDLTSYGDRVSIHGRDRRKLIRSFIQLQRDVRYFAKLTHLDVPRYKTPSEKKKKAELHSVYDERYDDHSPK